MNIGDGVEIKSATDRKIVLSAGTSEPDNDDEEKPVDPRECTVDSQWCVWGDTTVNPVKN